MIQRLSDGEAEGKLTVDIGGYRERRRTFLAEFAVNQARTYWGIQWVANEI